MRIETLIIRKENIERLKNLHRVQDLDEYKPNIHLMPYSGLLNDPNGLCFINGRYHIFYQWSPFCADHGMKHWGHYSTEDFVHFTHHKVAIVPTRDEENLGAYTGSAIIKDNEAYIFYTGNVFHNHNKKSSSWTLFTKMNADGDVSKQKKKMFTIDRKKYTHNFRDPYVFFKNGRYYLLHGAQELDKRGAVTLHWSDRIDGKYELLGNIRFSHLMTLGTMVECPGYFVTGKYEVLMFSPSKMDPYLETDEKPVFVVGYLSPEELLFHDIEKYQFVDLGFEFYAPQVLVKEDRIILLGWLGQVRLNPYPNLKYQWANTLTIPRQISAKNRKVYQEPIDEMVNLRNSKMKVDKGMIKIKSKESYELLIEENEGENFSISLENDANEKIDLYYTGDKFHFKRNNMSLPFYPEFGNRRSIKGVKIENIRIYFDVSICEVFINNGRYTMCGRYFIKNANKIIVDTKSKLTAYSLKPIAINYEELL